MPTFIGCPYKQECNEQVDLDKFSSFCQSENNHYIYCETYQKFEHPTKYPREWDEA